MSQHIKYNRAFDHIIETLVAARQGNDNKAAASLMAAVKSSDIKEAVTILESNNKAAYEREQRQLRAKAQRGRVRAELDFEDEELLEEDLIDDVEEDVSLDDVFDEDIDVGVEAEHGEEVDVLVEDFDDEEGDVVVEARRRGRTVASRRAAGRRTNPLASAIRRNGRR